MLGCWVPTKGNVAKYARLRLANFERPRVPDHQCALGGIIAAGLGELHLEGEGLGSGDVAV